MLQYTGLNNMQYMTQRSVLKNYAIAEFLTNLGVLRHATLGNR